MRKPNVGKPRSAGAMFSLSRRLPKLSLPASAPPSATARADPRVGKPAMPENANSGPLPAMRSAPPAHVPSAPPSVHTSANAAVAPVPHSPAALQPPIADGAEDACTRCGHDEELHPVRYVCDRYPYADPLQICGCESETLENVCPTCSHKGRAHKPRHRCRQPGCHCWGYELVAASL